ncbi:hypothetical protein HDU76_004040 [Blyttiomyces sp. JEL0837]|nr:hypothetical protein HDU76_004040 [Blyttiomyces sp. JEL0837]
MAPQPQVSSKSDSITSGASSATDASSSPVATTTSPPPSSSTSSTSQLHVISTIYNYFPFFINDNIPTSILIIDNIILANDVTSITTGSNGKTITFTTNLPTTSTSQVAPTARPPSNQDGGPGSSNGVNLSPPVIAVIVLVVLAVVTALLAFWYRQYRRRNPDAVLFAGGAGASFMNKFGGAKKNNDGPAVVGNDKERRRSSWGRRFNFDGRGRSKALSPTVLPPPPLVVSEEDAAMQREQRLQESLDGSLIPGREFGGGGGGGDDYSQIQMQQMQQMQQQQQYQMQMQQQQQQQYYQMQMNQAAMYGGQPGYNYNNGANGYYGYSNNGGMMVPSNGEFMMATQSPVSPIMNMQPIHDVRRSTLPAAPSPSPPLTSDWNVMGGGMASIGAFEFETEGGNGGGLFTTEDYDRKKLPPIPNVGGRASSPLAEMSDSATVRNNNNANGTIASSGRAGSPAPSAATTVGGAAAAAGITSATKKPSTSPLSVSVPTTSAPNNNGNGTNGRQVPGPASSTESRQSSISEMDLLNMYNSGTMRSKLSKESLGARAAANALAEAAILANANASVNANANANAKGGDRNGDLKRLDSDVSHNNESAESRSTLSLPRTTAGTLERRKKKKERHQSIYTDDEDSGGEDLVGDYAEPGEETEVVVVEH